ncbi:sumo activating enzyme [Grosmannia clavigera kw1407]|uniref:Sumo activating enzyme n=1 Tax=Grosmannia clavigera (strain kw1407 / UAMH 11150) TaxID=655863 RepID=F0XSG1_GROCL|nr:sumo activating enzyme [Grosmannia clavigera kw1407]EFW99089.1 sumo activating enzyme [Grosmannia clavigera kw1407]
MGPLQQPGQGLVTVLPFSQPSPSAAAAAAVTPNGTSSRPVPAESGERAMTEGVFSLLLPLAPNTYSPGTADEIALYDRQIRLWGMRAQEKIRSAHVLLITMRALGNEVAKNLVLAGIGALTIVDPACVTEADLGAQFLLGTAAAGSADAVLIGEAASEAERTAAATAAAAVVLGTNRATAASGPLRLMNPRVRISVDSASDIRKQAPGFYAGFDLVVATDLDPDTLTIVNTATRIADRPLYAAGTYGFAGFIFADLIEHDFVIVRDRANVAAQPGVAETRTRTIVDVQQQPGSKEAVTKRELYSTWLLASDAAGLPDAIRRSNRRLRNVNATLPCLRALWEFQQLHPQQRLPNPDLSADLATFTRLVGRKQQALGIPPISAERIRLFLQGIAAGLGSEISPVVTAVGGELAQDVINSLGHTQQPIQNLLVFDGANAQALTYALHPEGPLGRQLLAAATKPSPETAARAMAAVVAASAA